MKIELLPGFASVTDAEYYEAPLVSNSFLTGYQNGLTGAYQVDFKNAKFQQTLRTGQLLHLAVYEPMAFFETEEYLSTVERSASEEEQTRIRLVIRMADAAKAKSPVLMHFLKNPYVRFEVPLAFNLNGAYCKIKPDALIPKNGHDLKSTSCKSLDAFINTFEKYGYWRQAWLYKTGAGATNWYFTGVSKTEPHQVFIVDCKKHRAQMLAAKKQVLGLLEEYVSTHPMHAIKAQKYFKELAKR